MPPARRIRNPVTMDDLARRHQQIQAELARIGITLPGSLTSRTTRCQRPGCHWHASPPVLHRPHPTSTPPHGPSPTWTRKAGSRSITKTLTPQEAERLRPYFTAHRRLRQLITELEAISIELASRPATPTGQRVVSSARFLSSSYARVLFLGGLLLSAFHAACVATAWPRPSSGA